MKVTFKFKKRQSVYITLLACMVGLWMMVTRFGLPIEKVYEYAWVSVGLIMMCVALAAIAAGLIRALRKSD